jgi:hypothetical protein
LHGRKLGLTNQIGGLCVQWAVDGDNIRGRQ